MATKSFLSKEELEEAQRILKRPERPPDGKPDISLQRARHGFSCWLGKKLEDLLSRNEEWNDVGAIALGSWAREELSPRSDVDLLLSGGENQIAPLIDKIQESGLKLRYRLPENKNDWSIGVGEFDILALFHARAFTSNSEKILCEQREKILEKQGVKKHIFQAIVKERKERGERHDSISNYLEPNLKYGTGGLRDLQQGLYVYDLFKEEFQEKNDEKAREVFLYYKEFFLLIRHKLHLLGTGDILAATYQKEISDWFGYPSLDIFTKEVQRGLSRVNFYADLVTAKIKSDKNVVIKLPLINSLEDGFVGIVDNPGILMQHHVRESTRGVAEKRLAGVIDDKEIGSLLLKYLQPNRPDKFWQSLFRSCLIENCVSHMRPLIGLMQRDQYHRFTVDAHILQCLKGVARLKNAPETLGELQFAADKITDFDWQVLIWTALYHDIGKGKGGDHSQLGEEIVLKDLKNFQVSEKLTEEVAWMVKNHLELSRAAFRKNGRDKSTWKELFALGTNETRLHRLAIFTVADIQASNPDAWNSWKESLLVDLVRGMSSKKSLNFRKILENAQENDGFFEDFTNSLDEILLERLPAKELVSDYRSLSQLKEGALSPKIIGEGKFKWLRFHSLDTRSGVFVEQVQKIFALGVSIKHASIQTFEKYGVYNWFLLQSKKDTKQLRRILRRIEGIENIPSKTVKFSKITMVKQSEKEMIISFKGKDQSGALVSAAKLLHFNGLSIRWASVQTWGGILEDVFGVELASTEDLTRSEKFFTEALEMIKNQGLHGGCRPE